MRYIDRTGCKAIKEKGKDQEIKSMGSLTRKATKTAEENNLGLLKTSWGAYRIIKKSGLGAYEDVLSTLEEVNEFFLNLEDHKATRY